MPGRAMRLAGASLCVLQQKSLPASEQPPYSGHSILGLGLANANGVAAAASRGRPCDAAMPHGPLEAGPRSRPLRGRSHAITLSHSRTYVSVLTRSRSVDASTNRGLAMVDNFAAVVQSSAAWARAYSDTACPDALGTAPATSGRLRPSATGALIWTMYLCVVASLMRKG